MRCFYCSVAFGKQLFWVCIVAAVVFFYFHHITANPKTTVAWTPTANIKRLPSTPTISAFLFFFFISLKYFKLPPSMLPSWKLDASSLKMLILTFLSLQCRLCFFSFEFFFRMLEYFTREWENVSTYACKFYLHYTKTQIYLKGGSSKVSVELNLSCKQFEFYGKSVS